MIGTLLVSFLTLVQLNCENVFDCRHDEGKNDYEWLSDAGRHWSYKKYWRKLNNLSKEIISCGGEGAEWALPDLVALCEIENDSVMVDLTRKSLLRKAGYHYVMTISPDERGIDVALMYSPYSFALLRHHTLRVEPVGNRHPTRDILYASGRLVSGDTLHVYVVHAPSRSGGERASRPYRLKVAERLCQSIDSLRQATPNPHIVVAGDFNDYSGDSALVRLVQHGLTDVSEGVEGTHGAKGTYKYQGKWGSLDHIFVSSSWSSRLVDCRIHDLPFLLEKDEKYGGMQPRRTYVGFRYHDGFSDHLPLVARFLLPATETGNE